MFYITLIEATVIVLLRTERHLPQRLVMLNCHFTAHPAADVFCESFDSRIEMQIFGNVFDCFLFT